MGSGVVSPWHLAALLIVVLVCFGPKRLPEIGRMLGKGIREFKDGVTHHADPGEVKSPAVSRPLPVGRLREHDSI